MEKFVAFDVWCSLCKDKDTLETDDPCNECLTSPVNEDSTKPICFKEKDK